MKKSLLCWRIFAAVLLLAISTISWANGTEINGIYYLLDSSTKTASVTYTGTISSYTPHGPKNYNPSSTAYTGSITIPSTFTYNSTTYSVTSIGSDAFYDCSGLTSITIPNSVTSIGGGAFSGCSGLTSITIPNSVTSIGSSAFYGCTGLTSITIPESVTSIGSSAFSSCSGLTSVTIPESVTFIASYAFSGCSSLTSVTIPNSVTSIHYSTFSGCSGLTSVTIPNSVTSIGDCAFSDCSGLTSITIPNSVTSIGSQTFYNCSSLTSITIPNSVTSIGSSAFAGCPLQTIVNYGNKEFGENVFSDRTFLHTQLYVPEGTAWDYIYNTAWGQFHHIKEFASKADDIRNDAVYMIADRSGRNFPVYDKATKSLKNVAYTMNIDDNDTGACWRIIKDGSDTYLYNIGAGMYAAYDVENKLSLSIAPSAVDIKVTKEGTMINGKPAMLVVNKSVTPEPTFILGDANGNGEVEIGDVTSVLTLMATPEATGYNNKAADANGNGEIEIGDVTTILTIMAGGE